MDFKPASDEFCEMLRNACIAGGLRMVARREPGGAEDMLRTADEHSSVAATMLSGLKGGPILQDRPPYRRR